jgi:hypothetical protein
VNIDFLAGCICGAFLIPMLVRLVSTGRIDGWSRAPRRMPPAGETVLACVPGKRITAVTYNGPEGGGDIPEEAELYWRPMPPLPMRGRFKP